MVNVTDPHFTAQGPLPNRPHPHVDCQCRNTPFVVGWHAAPIHCTTLFSTYFTAATEDNTAWDRGGGGGVTKCQSRVNDYLIKRLLAHCTLSLSILCPIPEVAIMNTEPPNSMQRTRSLGQDQKVERILLWPLTGSICLSIYLPNQ